MLLNRTVFIGSEDGPPVRIVEDGEGGISILTSLPVSDGEMLYDELGNVVAVLGSRISDPYATFYESRSEQQTLTEDGPSGPYDFGWRAKHLGWLVNFEDGKVLFGSLAAVNQNRQNVGIEGPTSITGTDGSPSALYQNVNVTNRPAQVNGWKSYDSPTAYVLDPADIQQIDSTFIYADAFVSWTADSSTVTAPGSDMNGLVEYSPTNSIVFTDFT